jgi:hypothetical protein
MNSDQAFCVTHNGNALGWSPGVIVAKRVIEKLAVELQSKDDKLCMRLEEDGLVYRLFYRGMMGDTTMHILRATHLKQLRDPAKGSPENAAAAETTQQ